MIRVCVADDQRLMREGLRTLLSLEPDFEVVALSENGREAVAVGLSGQVDVILMDIRMPVMDGIAAVRAIREAKSEVRILMLTTYDDHDDVVGALSAGAAGYLLKDMPADEIAEAIRTVYRGGAVLPPPIANTLLDHVQSLSDPSGGLAQDRAAPGGMGGSSEQDGGTPDGMGGSSEQEGATPDGMGGSSEQDGGTPDGMQRDLAQDGVFGRGTDAGYHRNVRGQGKLVSEPALTDREREVLNCLAEGLSNREIASRLYVTEGTVKNHVSSLIAKLELRDRTQVALYAVRHGFGRMDGNLE